ncbi:hypothetical protein MNBD_ALPHA12-186 [hydrothermal vent metagenome]|uniref:Methyltransferase domain-containing protein n=1 Tax=hydrothermal vent metagenome TaxID=652676 RepID=A0A3B0TGM9_9ZZZZ
MALSSILLRLLNVPAMVRHLMLRRGSKSVHDPENDLELALYATLFGNNFLHFGYFKNPPADAQTMSMADMKKAMDDYADLLVARVARGEKAIELGCGMGGLLARLDAAGVDVCGVTPDKSQMAHIGKNWPHIALDNCKMEDLPKKQEKFDVAINSESFQYVDLARGIKKIDQLLKPDGRWLMSDYFRFNKDAHNGSGHILADFEAALAAGGFEIAERVDITENVLPTLRYAHFLAANLALPVAGFMTNKFFRRHAFFEYLFAHDVKGGLKKIRLKTIDAEIFRREKAYLLLSIVRRKK